MRPLSTRLGLADLLVLSGVALLVTGLALWSTAAATVVAGLALIVYGILVGASRVLTPGASRDRRPT